MMNTPVGNRQLRSFGLLVGAGFVIIGLAPLLFHRNVRIWAAIAGALLVGAALVAPAALKPVHRWWMKLAELLGWVNTRLILLAVYYAVIVPIAGVLRLLGRDPLKLKWSPAETSYRVPRTARPPSHMQRQY